MNYKNTFKGLMAYLNPIGSVGFSVDMYNDSIEYMTDKFYSEKGIYIPVLNYFFKFLKKIVDDNAEELFTDDIRYWDNTWWCDITIDPKKRQIKITAKNYGQEKENIKINFENTKYWVKELFTNQENLESIFFDFYFGYGGFDFLDITPNGDFDFSLTSEIKNSIINLINNTMNLGINFTSTEPGGEGVLVLNKNGNHRLNVDLIERIVIEGKTIIIDEEYINKYD